MFYKKVLMCILLTSFYGSEPNYGAVTGEGGTKEATQNFILSMGHKALNTLMDKAKSRSARFSEFKQMLDQNFDVRGTGTYMVGARNLANASPEQQQAYWQLLKDYIVKLYLDNFEKYAGQPLSPEDFTIERCFQRSSKPRDGWSVATTLFLPKNGGAREPLALEWRVFWNNGRPQVLDVYVEGLSMSRTKHDEFQSLIRREGFDGLLEELKKVLQ